MDFAEVFTIQIKPAVDLDFHYFFEGNIYHETWLEDSILAGYMLRMEDYLISYNKSTKAQKINISKHKRYTILEGLRLHQLGSAKGLKNVEFWRKVEAARHLPERTADSMRQFWKRYGTKSQEDYLIECIHEKIDFCFSFKQIPSPEFESRFRE